MAAVHEATKRKDEEACATSARFEVYYLGWQRAGREMEPCPPELLGAELREEYGRGYAARVEADREE